MKHMSIFLVLLLLVGSLTATRAQIGMGGEPHSSAVLDLKSPANDKAFYPPRLTTTQRVGMASPQIGAMVFDLDKHRFYLFDGQNWLPLATTTTNNLIPIDRTASDGALDDRFGYSVAISGDYAIVGAYLADIGSNYSQGAAYVFVRTGNGWSQQAKLTASDGAANDLFGISVAISGDYALVGASNDDNGANANQGSAYVFMRTGNSWTQQAKLTANDGAADDNFGYSVAISGDYALAGAYGDDFGAALQQGSAYMFVRSGTTWNPQFKLTAGDGGGGDQFGQSVAMSGSYALVGAINDDNGANANQGSAYVFMRTSIIWVQQAKLMASDGAGGDLFGVSVALSDDYALVGATGDDIDPNAGQGSAYVFVRSGTTWTQQAKLTGLDGAATDAFGRSVSISGDYAIVGVINADIGSNPDQGSAYVFKRTGTTWSETRQVTDTAPANTYNGSSVGFSNGSFIIGGPGFETTKGKVAFGTVDN